MSKHGGDCDGTWCDYCGCCEHGPATDSWGCRASEAPVGMTCPGVGCGCEGAMPYDKPEPPESVEDEPADDRPRQLHQETALF